MTSIGMDQHSFVNPPLKQLPPTKAAEKLLQINFMFIFI